MAISQYHIGYHESSGETVTAFPRLPRWPAASSQWHIRAVWRCTSALYKAVTDRRCRHKMQAVCSF